MLFVIFMNAGASQVYWVRNELVKKRNVLLVERNTCMCY